MGESGSTLTRHPLNTSFDWQPSKGPFRRLTEQQAEQFDRDGYVVIDDLIDDDTLAAAKQHYGGATRGGVGVSIPR